MPSRPQDDCLFCRIARGEVPSHPVYQSDSIFAFMDVKPIRTGHVQIIPREHFDYFDDLPEELAAEILRLGQRLAPVMRGLFNVKRVGFLFTGGDVAHAHAHVIPMVTQNDITSRRYIAEETLTFRDAPHVSPAELASTAHLIKGRLRQARDED